MDGRSKLESGERRAFLRNTAAISFGTLLAYSMPLAAGSRATSEIVAPAGRFTLVRTLQRGLIDGKNIVVRRTWEIGFLQQSNGFLVNGRTTNVEVDAPPPLAALAAIEKNRSSGEDFPLRLDKGGLIAFSDLPESGLDMEAVSVAASQFMAKADFSASEREITHSFLSQIDRAAHALISRFPSDLFFPTTEPMEQSRLMELPNGLTGEVQVRYVAETHADSALLRSSQRLVTTTIGASSMQSSESWKLQ